MINYKYGGQNNYLDWEGDDSVSDQRNDFLDEEDSEDYHSSTFHFDNLNQNDYSLNSPLISDDLDGYLKHKCNQNYPLVFFQPDWRKRDQFFDKLVVNSQSMRSTSELHHWWGKVNLSLEGNLGCARTFMFYIHPSHQETFIIPQILRENSNYSHSGYPTTVQRLSKPNVEPWTELFLMMHDIILIMNANSDIEIKNLKRILGFKTAKKNGSIVGFSMQTHLGPAYITGRVVYFKDHNILIDRLFALMMKDTWIARMNTLIGLKLRTQIEFNDNQIRLIETLYSIGDSMLKEAGNDAYDGIKLLEPLCNLKYSILAHTYRPLIPHFPSFSLHLERSVNELSDRLKHIKLFKETILNIEDVELLTVVYGSFRHWGHPFLNYLDGLEALYDQVSAPKVIDADYAGKLGSDLAYLVLRKKFVEKKKWFVKKELLSVDHVFYTHIFDNTWPTPKQIADFGDHWHELPLEKCFDIPEIVDPSLLYADRSHSMNRDEVLYHIKKHPSVPVPTKKVLDTLLHTPATDWPQFLKQINEAGIPRNEKIIGLKGKEREVKKKGRFFSLMSWMLREYFVITEYLIKEHFVPLFNGLTMADDLTTVISKLLDRTQGQGLDNYNQICFANHIDYEKWNNHQRKDATGPVFKVMGQFLGYENLIYRTHEFFEESLIYYNGRPDLMSVEGDSLKNNSDRRVCWEGQAGGLEGLRQKGWTVVGLLMIKREAKVRNTKVKILAQGDNQVICTQYKIQGSSNDLELRQKLQEVWVNNQNIMKAIKLGTERLGLIINNDETIQSADYLNYGKIPVFRGRILNLFTKRLSRVMCVTNDQLLNYGNIMATVSTNALTIGHFDLTPRDAITYYNFFGNLTRIMIERHNPVLGGPVEDFFSEGKLKDIRYKLVSLFLDPSLGGACGTSLSRFLTRSFPDPVTESLAFWKLIFMNTSNREIQILCSNAGNPRLCSAKSSKDLIKLIEKPESLNIPRGMSIANLLKGEIKKSLQCGITLIRNEVISDAVLHLNKEEGPLLSYLWSIKPLFPRFLSEFRASTFIGMTDNLVGLFQNSRTIRTAFSKKLFRDLNKLTWECELSTYRALLDHRARGSSIWKCSAYQADLLRQISWGQRVVGATIPHPLEMFDYGTKIDFNCKNCLLRDDDYITCIIPQGLDKITVKKGPYIAYLGSKTSESTSILQPWDKDYNVSVIRRAAKLRNSIHWFIKEDSLLATSVLSVLSGLTGEEWSGAIPGFKRTGSALHRFACSRQSSGGYTACNPAGLSWLITSTDTFNIIGSKNFDFMFQSSILYSQISSIEQYLGCNQSMSIHYHLQCRNCMREIEEPILNSPLRYEHPNVHHILNKWKPSSVTWSTTKPRYEVPLVEITRLSVYEISHQIGRAGGFLIGDQILGGAELLEDNSIFPLSIQNKLEGHEYMRGLFDGLLRASCLQVIHRRNMIYPKKARSTLFGTLLHCIHQLSTSPVFLNLVRKGPLFQELISIPHKTPPTYPITDMDMGTLSRNWLKHELYEIESKSTYHSKYPLILVFSDMSGPEVIGPYILSSIVTKHLMNLKGRKSHVEILRSIRSVASTVREGSVDIIQQNMVKLAYKCDSEIRHACSHLTNQLRDATHQYQWSPEFVCDVTSCEIYKAKSTDLSIYPLNAPEILCPLITGLRVAQLATGSHYKIRGIVRHFGIGWRDFLCGGDGSGGMTAALLRMNGNSKCIYNTLIEFTGSSLRGSSPGKPPAIALCVPNPYRCVNLASVWQEPSDLASELTWNNFSKYIVNFDLEIEINLIVIDAEIRDKKVWEQLICQLENHALDILLVHGNMIIKTYGNLLQTHSSSVIHRLIGYFKEVHICYTALSSSHTSEVYVVLLNRRDKQDVDCHIDQQSLYDALHNICAFKSDNEEFNRSLLIKDMNLWMGVPSELIPDVKIQLETLLSIAGIETGLSYSLSQIISLSSDKYENILGAIALACNALCNVTQDSLTEWSIPSDGQLKHLLVILLGFTYWTSWSSDDVNLYKYCNHVVNQGIVIGIRKITTRMRKRIGWSIGGTCSIAKPVSFKDCNAGLSSWIRVLSQLSSKVKVNWKWGKEILEINRKLTTSFVQKNTGVFQICRDRLISNGCKSTCNQALLNIAETSWRS
ncbi:large protein [Bughendera virus]|uniref:Replicase n=1 Tax=Bughendera virus TaxID=2740749 RepID=A0A7D4WYI0_9RHAB|nr:large protein [Bughendera virus]QKV49535.1 large protein [Bughendera virus]